jgi:hypothetical protein
MIFTASWLRDNVMHFIFNSIDCCSLKNILRMRSQTIQNVRNIFMPPVYPFQSNLFSADYFLLPSKYFTHKICWVVLT